MPDNVSYKVYLLDNKGGDGSSEVRRFVIDKDVSSSFPYLKEKLATVFPSLRPNVQFDVSWTDEDDDKVTIASDEELIIALTEMPGPVYKLNVTVREGKNPEHNMKEEEANNATVHPGVTCDGCDKDVRGYRYKCVVCDDYDLCSTCEAAGRHPGHNMMRIASPEVIWPQRMFKRLHKMQERADQRSRCRSAAQERCEKKSDKQSTASAPPPPGHHFPPPPPPGHGAPPPPPHGGAWAGAATGRGRGMFRGGRGRGFGMGGRCGFGDPKGAWSFGHAGGMGAWAAPAFEAMMRGWMGEQFSEGHTQNEQMHASGGSHEEAHAAASDAAKGAHDQAHAAAQEAASAAHEAAAAAAHEAVAAAAAASAAGCNMSGMSSPSEYLQNVGNFVAAALDPLGIDVQVDIETPDGNRNTVKASSAETEAGNQSDKSMSPSDDEEEWTVVSEKKSEEKTVEIPIQVTGQETEKAQQLYPSLPTNVSEEGSNANETLAAEGNQVTSQSVEEDPSVSSNQSVVSATASSSTAEAVKAPVAPPPVASHPDPKIQIALQAMMNMGFSNEGGWLANLLEAKNGDIGKVLDILQPVKK